MLRAWISWISKQIRDSVSHNSDFRCYLLSDPSERVSFKVMFKLLNYARDSRSFTFVLRKGKEGSLDYFTDFSKGFFPFFTRLVFPLFSRSLIHPSFRFLYRVILKYHLKKERETKKRKKIHTKFFTEGWVEFESKKVAKYIASTLNNTQISTRKRSKFYDVIWNIKYLPRYNNNLFLNCN